MTLEALESWAASDLLLDWLAFYGLSFKITDWRGRYVASRSKHVQGSLP